MRRFINSTALLLLSGLPLRAGQINFVYPAEGASLQSRRARPSAPCPLPFAGGADSTTALAGGHLTIGGGHPSEVMPHIKAGSVDNREVTNDPNAPTNTP